MHAGPPRIRGGPACTVGGCGRTITRSNNRAGGIAARPREDFLLIYSSQEMCLNYKALHTAQRSIKVDYFPGKNISERAPMCVLSWKTPIHQAGQPQTPPRWMDLVMLHLHPPTVRAGPPRLRGGPACMVGRGLLP